MLQSPFILYTLPLLFLENTVGGQRFPDSMCIIFDLIVALP